MHGMFVVSPGGWSFPSDGNKDSKAELHYEPSFDSLVSWLDGYKIANGKELGNSKQEVLDFTQIKTPVRQPDVFAPTNITPPRNLRERVTQWLAKRFNDTQSGAIQHVELEVAKERSKICLNCPHNVNWRTGCPPCVDNAERIILMMTQGKTVDKGLLACGLMGHPNEAAVVLEEKHLRHRVNFDIPDYCWMKAL